MSDKTKRKLIGFVAGERGSISKVKALAIGASVAGVASLSEVEGQWGGNGNGDGGNGDGRNGNGGDGLQCSGNWCTHNDGDRWVNSWPDDTIGMHNDIHNDTDTYSDSDSGWGDDTGKIIPVSQADWDDIGGETWINTKTSEEKGAGNGGWNDAGWDDAWDDWSGDWSNAPPKVEKVE